MRKLLLLLFLPASLTAQSNLDYSVSNLFRYGTSNREVNTLYRQKEYFENLADVKMSYADFSWGFRLLHDAPPENGIEFTGLRKLYAVFSKNEIVIRAGDSYTLFGRGLVLNLFEQRVLAFDTGLRGVKVSYSNDILRATATGGDVLYRDVLDGNRLEEYRVRAGEIEVDITSNIAVAARFVNGNVRLPITPPGEYSAQFDMPEVTAQFRAGDVDAYFSYAEKRTSVYPTFLEPLGKSHRGTGAYGSLSFVSDQFGISAEYKDYRFGIADPIDRPIADRSTKALAIQNPPLVHKEHSFTLLTRYPHAIDFGDEVGLQLDVFYTVGSLTGSLNLAAASRHYSFAPTGDTNRATLNPIYRGEGRSTSFLPSFSGKFSPFTEAYIDFLYYFEGTVNDFVELALNWREEKFAIETVQPGSPPIIETRRVKSIPIAAQYTLTNGYALKVTSEHQWVRDETNLVQSHIYNQLVSVGISRSSIAAVTIRYEFTTDKGTVDGRRDWTAIDIGVWIGKSHNLTLTVGGDRGGQVCANGVCRIVQPFLGVRGSLVSYL